jgi:toxin ParE1/3/4
MIIQWTTPATEQLVAAYEYVAAENPAAAQRVTNHIWETVELLGQHPMAGRKGRVAGTRELVVSGTPFVVGYRVEKSEVWILAVMHAARKWPEEF